MGLVRGDIVVEKKQFSALLKHVYPTAITAQNIKAGFHKVGIFPLSRAAVDTTQVVRVLPSADGSDATPSITQPTDTSIITQTPCPTCNINRVAHKNYLVPAGVIPESLANVLMSPALEKVRSPARVITSDEYFDLLVEKETQEKEKEEKKRWQRRRKKDKPRMPKDKRIRHLFLLKMENTALSAVEWSHLAQEMRPLTNGSSEICAICGSTWSVQK